VSKARKISVIDDDDLVREGVGFLVLSLGYEVNAFASAEAYLASDHARDTSCVIVDVHMPGMTGIDLQKRLIDDGVSTPIIFMSGDSTEAIIAHAMKAGAIGFLRKPPKVECLIEYLNRALEIRLGSTCEPQD
jgi:FixJ family two-component response regulator